MDYAPSVVSSAVPARLDRLPWSRFHTRLVVALGVAWVLDGLEITIASLIGPVLQSKDTLALSSADVGRAASVYLIGEVVGALVFGYLADRLGRRRLFMATLALYLAANGLTALAFDYTTLLVFRFFAGAGIGGEYSAINSAIDEIIPARHRGRADLAINGTYWLGAIVGTYGEAVLLDPSSFPIDLGWRIGLLLGPAIGLAMWPLRSALPESPRWLLTHGHEHEAERIVADIESEITARGQAITPAESCAAIELRPTGSVGYVTLARVLFKLYPSRCALSVALMSTQSFLYNAIFFSYGLVLVHFYDVPAAHVPHYFYAFALGNLLGPLTLGRFFDTIGRKPMIAGTYIVAGVLLAVSGYLFTLGALTATTQTVWWSVTFFIASAAASSAYLTVSEIFPVEVRAQAIALFFAMAQVVGATGPWMFGVLIGDQQHPDPTRLFIGYFFGAGMMVLGGVAEAIFGVKAECVALEEVACPLSLIQNLNRRAID